MSEKSHGREEILSSYCLRCPLMNLLISPFEWKGLKEIMRWQSPFRSIIAEPKKEPEMMVRYYISSADLTAEKFATVILKPLARGGKRHWRLDGGNE